MAKLYGPGDKRRVGPLSKPSRSDSYRSPWRRDYARLIHSPCFRRLQGKTQVFPGHESDFFRNRLTHSLEVAQVAKSIALFLNDKNAHFKALDQKLEPDIVEIAGLAHDLGHPPFGHNGEEALDECMRDFGGFEGNAQSLRIVSRLEKKETIELTNDLQIPHFDGTDLRCGLNLTYRVMASLLKYDEVIPLHSEDRKNPGEVCKGYYAQDIDLVQSIKENVLPGKSIDEPFKTIECSIMDIADDIAYSTYDLEDNFKAGFLMPIGLFALDDAIYDAVISTVNHRLGKYYGSAIAKRKALADKSDILVVLFEVFFSMFDDYETDAKTLSAKEIPI